MIVYYCLNPQISPTDPNRVRLAAQPYDKSLCLIHDIITAGCKCKMVHHIL